MATLHVDVVSAEGSIFSGEAKFVALPGESGELGFVLSEAPRGRCQFERYRLRVHARVAGRLLMHLADRRLELVK